MVPELLNGVLPHIEQKSSDKDPEEIGVAERLDNGAHGAHDQIGNGRRRIASTIIHEASREEALSRVLILNQKDLESL